MSKIDEYIRYGMILFLATTLILAIMTFVALSIVVIRTAL